MGTKVLMVYSKILNIHRMKVKHITMQNALKLCIINLELFMTKFTLFVSQLHPQEELYETTMLRYK